MKSPVFCISAITKLTNCLAVVVVVIVVPYIDVFDQVSWEEACLASYDGDTYCRLGTPFPEDLTGVDISDGENGMQFNCYVNRKIDDYWVKQLESKLKEHVPEIAKRLEETKS